MKTTFDRSKALFLYRALGSEKQLSRRLAMTSLEGMDNPVWRFLSEQIQLDILRYRRDGRNKTVLAIMCALSLTTTLPALWTGGFAYIGSSFWAYLVLNILTILSVTCFTACCATRHIIRRRIRNALFISQSNFPQHDIGVLVDAMQFGDEETSHLAQSLLIRLLSKAECGDLSVEQHRALCRVLYGTNALLIIAILKAFERIGLPLALDPVRRLRHCPIWLADAKQIEQSACTCLHKLSERSRCQAEAGELLRPVLNSHNHSLFQGDLLIPATRNNKSMPRQLVRPVDSPQDASSMPLAQRTARVNAQNTPTVPMRPSIQMTARQ